MNNERFEWGWLNVNGVRGDLEEIVISWTITTLVFSYWERRG